MSEYLNIRPQKSSTPRRNQRGKLLDNGFGKIFFHLTTKARGIKAQINMRLHPTKKFLYIKINH